jgi:ArsR family transcriptional regulator, arsenate/arsenite/antimonite-responsive transcriptional repressor
VVDSISVDVSPPAAAVLEGALAQFRALADPTRLRIVAFLSAGERCACELGEAVDVPANLLSHHLKVLRQAGLIVGTRRGRWIDYRLRDDGFRGLERLLAGIRDLPVASPPPQPCAPAASVVS